MLDECISSGKPRQRVIEVKPPNEEAREIREHDTHWVLLVYV